MNVEIANRLVDLRKGKGLSQEELAEKLGISRQAVSKWERAESSPDTDNLIALAKIYQVSLDELLLISEEKAGSKVSSADIAGKFEYYQAEHENAMKRKGGMFLFPYPVVAVILFFLFSFTNIGWGQSWLIFLTIPIYYGIAEMVHHRKKNKGR